MYVIFTDTDTDMTPEVAKKYGYHLISMPYTMDDKEIYPYVDFDKFESHEFYEKLRGGAMPKTSGLSPETYTNYFEPFFKEGKDVLYVHFSAKMSGTFEAMRIALIELKERYPERQVYTLDTRGISIGAYNIACEVGEMYLQGKTVDEILEWSKTEVDKFAVYFFAEDLSFFGRSGRVKSFTAFMGNLLGIRPIIYMGSDGMMTSIDKAKGRRGALTKIMQYVKDLQEDIKDHQVVIAHADVLATAQMLGDLMKEEFGDDLAITYLDVNPTAGCHCGPNTLGISFHAKHR